MNEGNTSPRAQLRAGPTRYASALAVLQESLQQLGDLIRLQASEYDRLTSGSLDIGKALYAWRFATTAVSDSLNRVESAHAVVEALSPDVVRVLHHAQDNKAADG